MAFPVNESEIYALDCLPGKIEFVFKAPRQGVLRAQIRNKKATVACWLDVSSAGSCVVVHLSESLLCLGPGKYYVDLMDNCHVCKTVCVRLENSCFVTVKSVESDDDELKEPYWKRKANG